MQCISENGGFPMTGVDPHCGREVLQASQGFLHFCRIPAEEVTSAAVICEQRISGQKESVCGDVFRQSRSAAEKAHRSLGMSGCGKDKNLLVSERKNISVPEGDLRAAIGMVSVKEMKIGVFAGILRKLQVGLMDARRNTGLITEEIYGKQMVKMTVRQKNSLRLGAELRCSLQNPVCICGRIHDHCVGSGGQQIAIGAEGAGIKIVNLHKSSSLFF